MNKLSPFPARTDLTDRECAKLIGGMIGTLLNMTDMATVKRAVQWWYEHPEPWELLKQTEIRNAQG